MVIVGEAANGLEAIEAAKRHQATSCCSI